MSSHEEKIKETRTIEAVKKNYMGAGGKFGCIAMSLGHPITEQLEGGDFYNTTYFSSEIDESTSYEDETDAVEFNRSIPTMGMSDTEQPAGWEWDDPKDTIPYTMSNVGWKFDGLSRGMHLEIVYLKAAGELRVSYKGYTVYKEVEGELEGYFPLKDWEDKIENLYKVASKIKKQDLKNQKERNIQEGEKQKARWFQSLRNKWGI